MAFLQLIQNFLININWEQARNIAQTVQSIVTIFAVAVGSFVYFTSRKPFPKVTQKHTVIHEFLDEDILWIRVTLEINNQGLVRLALQELEAHVQIITPLLNDTREQIEQFKNDKYPDVDWLSINGREIDLAKIRKTIEPGEIDYIFCDFILQDDENFAYSKVSMILITTNLKLKLNRLASLLNKIIRSNIVYKLSTPYKVKPNQEENNE
jgi:hypothetical protein